MPEPDACVDGSHRVSERNPLIFRLNLIHSLALATVLILFGRFLRKRYIVFYNSSIPSPIIGGFFFAVLCLVGYTTKLFYFQIDFSMERLFMNMFFSASGFILDLSLIKKGGRKALIFLLLASFLAVLQNILGISLAQLLGVSPLLGLAGGSISMTGGHGTSIAFVPYLSSKGLPDSQLITLTFSSLGLVFGSYAGIFMGRHLIRKLKRENHPYTLEVHEDIPEHNEEMNLAGFENAVFQIVIAMSLGAIVSEILASFGFIFPISIGAMLASSIITNTLQNKIDIRYHEIAWISDLTMIFFLVFSMMQIRLWLLLPYLGSIMIIMFAQILLMLLFGRYVTWPVLGRNYDAAYLTAGHCGFGLGAVSVGRGNMTILMKEFDVKTYSFYYVSVVGGIFINIINSFIIVYLINIL